MTAEFDAALEIKAAIWDLAEAIKRPGKYEYLVVLTEDGSTYEVQRYLDDRGAEGYRALFPLQTKYGEAILLIKEVRE